MTAASQNVDTQRRDGEITSYPVANGVKLYKGVALFGDASDSGYAISPDGSNRTLANGDVFLGICAEEADNTSGADAAIDVRAEQKGVFLLTFSDSLTEASKGSPVFVNNTSDDSVVTTTSDAGNPECQIGIITQFVNSTHAYVRIDEFVGRKADSVVGGASNLFEIVSVTVATGQTTGTATVTAGSTPIAAVPQSNQDQFIDNVAVSSTTVTVTLASAATADNVFKVTLLKA